jgi:APA family basic amino acid/polyamine antiporter
VTDASPRKLGLWMCTALVVGNMIGSGTYLMPASLAPYGGVSLLGWLITATGSILLALVFAKLSQWMARSGGPHAFTRAAFGDFAGFIVAWSYWVACWTGNAAIAVGFVGSLTTFFPAINTTPHLGAGLAVASVWVCTLINIRGLRTAGGVQLITSVLKYIPLVVIGLMGFRYLRPEAFTPFNPTGQSLLSATSTTMTLTLWAFLGLECATVPAGNVEDPTRTVPRATVLGTVVTAVAMVLACATVMAIVPRAALAESTAPFADAAARLWGPTAGYLMGGAAVVACFGALNGWTLVQGQVAQAAADEGLFPAPLSKLNAHGAPALALAATSLLVSLLVWTNYTGGLVKVFTFVILLSTAANLVPYLFCAMAALQLMSRRMLPEGAELPGPGFVAVALLAFAYALWAFGGSGKESVYWGSILMLGGIPLHVYMTWKGRTPSAQA